MDEKDSRLTAGLAAAGAAYAAWWRDTEQDLFQRLQRLKADHRDTKIRLNEVLASGDWTRLLYPFVRDALSGLAAASPPTPAPSIAPQPWTGQARPDLSSESTVASLNWPPNAGQYDATGRASTPGQMALAFFTLTYEEPRAMLQGLTQSRPPTSAAKVQLFRAANALSAAIADQALTLSQWKALWSRLFRGGSASPSGFTGRTEDAAEQILGELATGKDGVYTAEARCGIQRDDGAGGSLRIAGTYSKFKGALSLVRTDRLLAQLSQVLVGVDANFVVLADRVALKIRGQSGMVLYWDNQLTLQCPT